MWLGIGRDAHADWFAVLDAHDPLADLRRDLVAARVRLGLRMGRQHAAVIRLVIPSRVARFWLYPARW